MHAIVRALPGDGTEWFSSPHGILHRKLCENNYTFLNSNDFQMWFSTIEMLHFEPSFAQDVAFIYFKPQIWLLSIAVAI